MSTLYKDVNFCLRCGAKLQLIHGHERRRPTCPACGWVFYKNAVPASACVIIQDQKLLLIKRTQRPRAGWWALPSGYMEINQSPEDAAVAEMQQETGLIGQVAAPLGWYWGTSPIYTRVISFGFLMTVTGGRLQAGDDAGEARWYSFEQLPKIAFDSHRYFWEQAQKLLFR